MPRHKPKRRRFEFIERGFGHEDGNPRITPPPIIYSGNLTEQQKREASRLRIQKEQEYFGMDEVIERNIDPKLIMPKWWLKGIREEGNRGGKERK